MILVTLTAVAICGSLRLYHSFVPRGASAMPFLFASIDGGTIESPNGTVYEVWFNDAGAAPVSYTHLTLPTNREV